MIAVEETHTNSQDENQPILTIKNLKTYFPILSGILKRVIGHVKAVDGVDFNLYKGETLGLVGESGCGKTTIARTILNLTRATSGQILYRGQRIDNNFTKIMRKKIQLVFQDPDSSLNPRWKIVDIIGEPLRLLQGIKKRSEIRQTVLNLLETVSLKRENLDRFPHEFSGGQKQRIVIARALACNPEIMILDEPTSSLDVSVQAQILNLLRELQKEFDLAYLFITHNLSVIQHIGDRIAVMYLGKFVETGTVAEIFTNPMHPYTKALLSARPSFDPVLRKNRIILEGEIPSPMNPPSGCAFNPRCQEKDQHFGCGLETPNKIQISGDHYIWCLPQIEKTKKYKDLGLVS